MLHGENVHLLVVFNASALALAHASADHRHMAVASTAQCGLVAVALALSLGCGPRNRATDVSAAGGASQSGDAGAAPAGDGATASGAGATDGAATSGGEAGAAAGAAGDQTGDAIGGAPAGPSSSRQTPRPSLTVPGTSAGYWEYLPPHYGNGALYPLLIFGHGAGQSGNGTTELTRVLKHGPPKLIAADQWPEDRTFIVLSVQHTGSGCPSSQEVDDFLTFALGKYDVDPQRVYLTGLSCGANGDWNYLGDHLTERVAAAVLIAGNAGGAFATAMCQLGSVPIWAFHGDADTTVPPAEDGEPIAALRACDPAPVDLRYTLYPGVGHDCWTMTYDLSNPANDIYAWLMSHSN